MPPRCPNHKTILIRTSTPGVGICPISDARFQYKAVSGTEKQKLRTDGSIVTEVEYKVEGND